MQLRLVSWFLITLNFLEYIGSQHTSRVRRQGRMHPNVSQGCQGGCATCSDYNGCLSCKPRLFFVLERIGMKQIGVCLSSCPSGYFGTRSPEINKCAKCKTDCETCFNQNFCTRCKSGFYLHIGKCLESCPEGLEHNNHTMECSNIVHCEASEWSPWSPCTKKGKTCGFKRGNETRVREILQHPSARGNPCPPTSETRKCIVQRKKCQKGGKGTILSSYEFDTSQPQEARAPAGPRRPEPVPGGSRQSQEARAGPSQPPRPAGPRKPEPAGRGVRTNNLFYFF
uniref:R-spondin-3 n=1 Tax=Sphenodon punctatus TaxID=8508 RepID=A0A8D0GTC8_SPHPU